MYYSDNLIVRKVPKAVRDRTRENMDVYNMDLYDAFNEAVRECTVSRKSSRGRSTELTEAWYFNDYRRFIPSAYNPMYLDSDAFPLKY